MKKTNGKEMYQIRNELVICAQYLHLDYTCFKKRRYDVQLVGQINMKKTQTRFKKNIHARIPSSDKLLLKS